MPLTSFQEKSIPSHLLLVFIVDIQSPPDTLLLHSLAVGDKAGACLIFELGVVEDEVVHAIVGEIGEGGDDLVGSTVREGDKTSVQVTGIESLDVEACDDTEVG